MSGFILSLFTVRDALTRSPVKGFEVKIPLLAQVLEPWIGPAKVFTLLYIHPFQILSWILWLTGLSFLFLSWKKKEIKEVFFGILEVLFLFSLFLLYTLFFPLPPYPIEPKKKGMILFDFQSHTIFSHDGIITPEENISFHLKHNYQGWVVTEHNNLEGGEVTALLAEKISPSVLVLSGAEVSGGKRTRLLLYRVEKIPPFKGKKLVEEVKKQGGITGVCAQSYEDEKEKIDWLLKLGVNGFEIMNQAHPLSPLARERLKRLSQKGFFLVGSTDWHGWGSVARVWTVFSIPGWERLSPEKKEKAIFERLRRGETKVVYLGWKEKLSSLHLLFEPWVEIGLYLFSLNLFRLGFLGGWIIFFYLLFWLFPGFKKWSFIFLYLFFFTFLLLLGFKFLLLWKMRENKILLELTVLIFLFTLLSFLFLLRSFRRGLSVSSD